MWNIGLEPCVYNFQYSTSPTVDLYLPRSSVFGAAILSLHLLLILGVSLNFSLTPWLDRKLRVHKKKKVRPNLGRFWDVACPAATASTHQIFILCFVLELCSEQSDISPVYLRVQTHVRKLKTKCTDKIRTGRKAFIICQAEREVHDFWWYVCSHSCSLTLFCRPWKYNVRSYLSLFLAGVLTSHWN